jgi:hypothetical protein
MKDVKSLKGVVLVVLVALMTVSVGAQRADAPMSAARSYALQRQLQTIDQHRAEFVQQLLADWTPYVDVNAYNLQEELAPIAMKVPAWQLYGASLVGDFRTMVRVLKGQVGAGRFINAFAEPQPKSFMDGSVPGPDVFGDYNNNLVFTPIPPCRLVDTRNSGARTGPLLPGIPRSFDLTTTAFSKGQGGVVLLSDCPTLPSFSNLAWAVNVTVTGYGGLGDLRAWPYLGTLPLASIINYGTGTAAIANGLTLTGCYGCADDITVVADAVATHLIIDVTGYYEQAGCRNLDANRERELCVRQWRGLSLGHPARRRGSRSRRRRPSGWRIPHGYFDNLDILDDQQCRIHRQRRRLFPVRGHAHQVLIASRDAREGEGPRRCPPLALCTHRRN